MAAWSAASPRVDLCRRQVPPGVYLVWPKRSSPNWTSKGPHWAAFLKPSIQTWAKCLQFCCLFFFLNLHPERGIQLLSVALVPQAGLRSRAATCIFACLLCPHWRSSEDTWWEAVPVGVRSRCLGLTRSALAHWVTTPFLFHATQTETQ